MNRFIVYAHYTTDTNELFYIGEGLPRRAYTKHGRNIYWQRKVAKHNGFIVKILAKDLTKKQSTRLESKIIIALKKRGYRLTNLLESTISEYIRKVGNPKTAERNRRNKGILSPTFGLSRPDLVERNKSGNFKRFARPVLCIELNKSFSSVKEANISIGKKPCSTGINKLLSNSNTNRKTAYGYTWKFIA